MEMKENVASATDIRNREEFRSFEDLLWDILLKGESAIVITVVGT